jgi:IclR family pca regulon transcriptional regulator
MRKAGRPIIEARATAEAKATAETGAADSSLFVQSVAKAIQVLRVFDGTRRHLSLAQIAQIAGLDRSAAQRFTHTLQQLGYLAKDPQTRLYELTPRTLEFGYSFIRSSDLVERAMPYLLHLSKETEETTNLTLLDDLDIVFVSRFMSRHGLGTDVIIGTRLPAFCTAPGLAMLAHVEDAAAAAIVDRSERRAFTPHTVVDKDAILTRLERVRQTGYALACEQIYIGDISVAAPVIGPSGHAIAALSVAVSTARWTVVKAEETLPPLVVAAAAAISHRRLPPPR